MGNFSLEKIKEFVKGIMQDKKRLIKILIIILIILLAVAMRINENNKNKVIVSKNMQTEVEEEFIYVDVDGAVVNPGVYKLKKGSRVFEAIKKAGGLSDNADTSSLNQAKFVEDGEKITIPVSNDDISYSDGSDSKLININTADKSRLTELSGVGDAIADRIIEYRNKTRFSSIEDIKNVKGIGDATFEKIKNQITV